MSRVGLAWRQTNGVQSSLVPAYRVEMLVPLPYPLKNQLTPSRGPHAWHRFRNMKRDWHLVIPQAPIRLRQVLPRRFEVWRLMAGKDRLFDLANLYFPLAFILDDLVLRGWFLNDTPKRIPADPVCRQRPAHPHEQGPSTLIVIEDIIDKEDP